jgi:outer membrane protein assembly factor BamB
MMTKRNTLGVLSLLACSATILQAGDASLWTVNLKESIKWQELTDLGVLIVGTDGAVQAYDPEDGELLWTRDDIKKSNPNNAREIPGTPWIVANRVEGIGNSKIVVNLLDYMTGETVWSTPEIFGQYLDTLILAEQGLLISVAQTYDGENPGIHLLGLDLETGEQHWDTYFAKSGAIPLHMADNSGKFIPTMDLSGYFDPIVDGDHMYLGYLGIHSVNLKTGAVEWGVEFPPGAKDLKRTYAPLRIEGDLIYGAGGGSVYAVNRLNGEVKWESDRVSSYAGLFKARDNAIVSQIEISHGKVFARYGGNFSNGKTSVLREPLGILVLDALSGEELYNYDEIKEGLTNLLLLPETNTVMFADATNLYGLDLTANQPVENFRVPIEFKRSMGGGDVAKIGLGITGGLMGIAKAAASSSKARLDVPVAVMHKNGHIIVQGKQHLMSFNPQAHEIVWSTYYPAPSNAFADAALLSVTALATVAGNAQVATSSGYASSSYSSGVNQIHGALDRYNAAAGKRYSATQNATDRTFVLTKVEVGGKKGVGLVGIRLEDGEDDEQFLLGKKDPIYLVDDATGRLFFFKDKKSIQAFQL